jgi:hypothetical protein
MAPVSPDFKLLHSRKTSILIIINFLCAATFRRLMRPNGPNGPFNTAKGTDCNKFERRTPAKRCDFLQQFRHFFFRFNGNTDKIASINDETLATTANKMLRDP